MRVDVQTDGGVALVQPVGDIDGKTAPDFQATVLPLVTPGARLVLDLGQVPFMSSAGLRGMLLVYREAKAKGARIVLARINGDIRNSMAATGFLPFFDVRESVPDAAQAATASR